MRPADTVLLDSLLHSVTSSFAAQNKHQQCPSEAAALQGAARAAGKIRLCLPWLGYFRDERRGEEVGAADSGIPGITELLCPGGLLCASDRGRYFAVIISGPLRNVPGRYCYQSHFTDEETEAERS